MPFVTREDIELWGDGLAEDVVDKYCDESFLVEVADDRKALLGTLPLIAAQFLEAYHSNQQQTACLFARQFATEAMFMLAALRAIDKQ